MASSRELLALMASGLADAPAPGSFSCRVESAVNVSTGEHVPLPDEPIVLPLSELEREGDFYTKQVWTEGTDRSEETTHGIDSRTGRYEAVSIEKLHDWGEEHLIRRTGTCERVTRAKSPSLPGRG